MSWPQTRVSGSNRIRLRVNRIPFYQQLVIATSSLHATLYRRLWASGVRVWLCDWWLLLLTSWSGKFFCTIWSLGLWSGSSFQCWSILQWHYVAPHPFFGWAVGGLYCQGTHGGVTWVFFGGLRPSGFFFLIGWWQCTSSSFLSSAIMSVFKVRRNSVVSKPS